MFRAKTGQSLAIPGVLSVSVTQLSTTEHNVAVTSSGSFCSSHDVILINSLLPCVDVQGARHLREEWLQTIGEFCQGPR